MSRKETDAYLVTKVVQLGNVIRRHRSEGNLQSVVPPTLWGYMAFLRMSRYLPHLSLQQIAMVTLLGNASIEDRKLIHSVFNEVFGLFSNDDGDSDLDLNLF